MKIKLKPFEIQSSISFDEVIPVLYDIETVGTCKIIKNVDGSYHGVLNIKDPSFLDKFVYYLDSNLYKHITDLYYFSGLKLRDEDPQSETCKLSDLLIC